MTAAKKVKLLKKKKKKGAVRLVDLAGFRAEH